MFNGALDVDTIGASSIVAGIGDDTLETGRWYVGKCSL
jgi:hypothetical protein